MQNTSNTKKAIAIGATCAVVGAGAGIAGSMAAPKSSDSSSASGASGATGPTGAKHRRGRFGGPGLRFRHRIGGPGHAVHSESVVPQRDGTGFQTVVTDAGKLKSTEGNTLTVALGTATQTYKTVEIDVGSDATVRRNGRAAKVSDLRANDFVFVFKDSSGYRVMALDAATRRKLRNAAPGRFRGGHGGPGRMGHPAGPPPGARY